MRVEYPQKTLPKETCNRANSQVATFHLWMPNIFEFKGGIQVYSAFLLQALRDIYPQANYEVFLKHDTRTDGNLIFSPQTRFHFSGKWRDRWRTLMFAIQLFAYGIWQKPDLIITTHLNFAVAAYYLKRLTGIPYIAIAHGVEAWNITNPRRKKALLHADKILAVGEHTRKRLLSEQDLDPNKVSILCNTFDSDRFQIQNKPNYLLQRYGLHRQQKIILTVARLSKTEQYKGYDSILRAILKIKQVIPDIHYILVGQGDDFNRIKQLIEQLQLQENVTLSGFVPDEELSDYYNLCDLFAMPSKGEGFGIVYLEAMACGKPVLAGNKDGAVDALCKGEFGALVDPDDIDEITLTAIDILQNRYPNPLIYHPEKLREKVIKVFGFENFQSTLSKQIDDFLS